MSSQARVLHMTVEAYLKSEQRAKIRHEYVDGQVFAMSGASEAHNLICSNLNAILHSHLRGSGCRAYTTDIKVRIETSNSFYYPDLMVTCEPFEAGAVFKEAPVLLVEVLSPSTKAIDRREKLIAYKHISSLQHYLIIHQNRQKVEFYRRESQGHWQVQILHKGDELMLDFLPGGPLKVSVTSLYEGFNPMPIVEESNLIYGEDDDDPYDENN
jgi:Uma2 family endonuclease